MKTTQLQKALILVTVVSGVLAAGCELIVDFDRTKIPVESIDSGGLVDAAGLGDGAVTDTDSGSDGGNEEASTTEDGGGTDGGADADADAG